MTRVERTGDDSPEPSPIHAFLAAPELSNVDGGRRGHNRPDRVIGNPHIGQQRARVEVGGG